MAEIWAVWAIRPAGVVPGLAANVHRRKKLPVEPKKFWKYSRVICAGRGRKCL